jgi:hypothetical protein
MKNSFAIFVFSFNRGEFLENCISSIEKFMPWSPIYLIDDNSTDKKTLNWILINSKRFTLIPPSKGKQMRKSGGLHKNMEKAFLELNRRGIDHCLFLQDDMQIVRKVTQVEISTYTERLTQLHNCMQISTNFRKKIYIDLDNDTAEWDDKDLFQFREVENDPRFLAFIDVGIFSVNDFFNYFGDLDVGELNNNSRAKSYGLKVRNLKEPFTMYLPFPTANRAKKKGVLLWVVERLSGADFYPISGIIDANINDYMNGELHISSAEDVLVCELPFRSSRWSFAGGIDNLRARGGARFILFILFYIYSKIFWSHRS